MRKNTLKKAMLTVLITSGLLVSGAKDLGHYPAMYEGMCNSSEIKSDKQLTKAIYYEGEYIPMIELPVVEITAKIPTDKLVTAEIVDGKVVPSILLDEVVIIPTQSI